MVMYVAKLLGLAVFATAGSSPAQPPGAASVPPGMLPNMARHHQVMMFGVPAPYRGYRDRTSALLPELKRGAALFGTHCASCHGIEGRGDGAVGRRASPPPANLVWLAHTPMSKSDPYMYWTIVEGGEPFGSDMPAYRQKLSPRDIWAVIRYVQFGPSGR
ncbi:c-type cytochrome [Sphingomonas oryzagri]